MNPPAPKISIVLPVHNGERFLAKAIESCLAQTLRDFELIIVDDCSTDSSARIIREYAARDSRIQIIRNATNQKLPNSLNIGFAKARGEYLTWTSDDNEFYPNALSKLAAVLDADATVGFAFADFNIEFMQANKTPTISRAYTNRYCRVAPQKHMPHTDTAGACFLYRADVAAQTHGYDDNWRIVEDYEYFLRLYLLTKFQYVNEVLYHYRAHENSLSGLYGDDHVQHLTGLAQLHHMPAMKKHPKISRRILGATYYRLAKRMRTCPKCMHRVKRCLWEAVKMYPLILLRPIEKRIWYY